jgi:hypothetical protein
MPSRPEPVSLASAADPSRLPMGNLLCATVLLLGIAMAGASSPDSKEGTPPTGGVKPVSTTPVAAGTPAGQATKEPAAADRHLREGTEIVDVPGSFRVSGGRVIFSPTDGRQSLIGLENLNLERVSRALADHPEQPEWIVTGTVTEYRGTNFLLLRRVVLKNRSLSRTKGGLLE